MSGDGKSPFDPTAKAPESSLLGTVTGILGLNLDTLVTVFAIDPSETATYHIGNTHRLIVQQGGLCALSAPYGVNLWDTVCEVASLPVLVTAKSWTDSQGRARIDFTPSLRFAPLAGGQPSAVLYLKDNAAAHDLSSKILYCGLLSCMDEGASDPTMATMHDAANGWVYRRIKHFSGYQVATGFTGEPSDSTAQQQ